MPRALDTKVLLSIVGTLGLGVGGGMIFDFFSMPAAYLSGSMLAVGVAAVANLKVALPQQFRDPAFVALGAVLGSTINQETIESLPGWPVSLLLLVLSLAALVVIVPIYLKKVHGLDHWTAKLCAIPGALSVVVGLAEDYDADVRRVALVQTCRLAILMVLIPVIAGVGFNVRQPAPAGNVDLPWSYVAMLVALCTIGSFAGKWFKIPAPFFMGSLVISSGIYGAGVMEGRVPNLLFWPALVVLGASVGTRFRGTSVRFMKESLLAGIGGTAISIAVTGLFAVPAAHFLSLPVIQVWLAYAPGGFEAMTVLAFSLGVDPAFVAGHQLFRFMVLSFALPFLFRGASRQASGK